MLKTRLFCGLCILAAAFWAFALPAGAQTFGDGPGVTVDLGGAALMHRPAVVYPASARTNGIEGTVVVQATLDAAGNVSDARVMSGPEELRRAVLESVLSWHFAGGGGTRQVSVSFQKAAAPATAGPQVLESRFATLQGMIGSVPGAPRSGAAASGPRKIGSITVTGLSDSARADLLSRLPFHEGDPWNPEDMAKLTTAARAFDEHLMASASNMGPGDEVQLRIMAPGSGVVMAAGIMPTPSLKLGFDPATGRLTVSGDQQQAKLVSRVTPTYPPLAKQARIQGVVRLSAVIGKTGSIQDLKVVSGHPLLVQAALDAVKQWVYQPTLLNGQPVEVITTIDVNFTLAE